MPSLEPPDDESIRTLYVGGLDARISEQDLRDNFYAHGEIESVKMVLQKACAFITYTTREGAEKAAEELSNKLVIKGLRMKLLWGRPQALKLESEGGGSDEAKQQAALTHSGLLPRAVISQQQNQPPLQALPPGTLGQAPPMPYFNIPPLPPQHERAYYPSMDPQRMGALVPSQEGGGPSGSNENRSGPEQQQHHQRYGYNPSMGPPPPSQFYPPYYNPQYGYMGPPPPQGGPRPPPGGPHTSQGGPSNQQYPPQQYQGRMPPQGPAPPEDGTSQQQQP